MKQPYKFFSGQVWMRKRMRCLGYPPYKGGLCLGISYVGIQAFLARRVPAFDSAIESLSTTDSSQFHKDIETHSRHNPMRFFYHEKQPAFALKVFLDQVRHYQFTQKKFLPTLRRELKKPVLRSSEPDADLDAAIIGILNGRYTLADLNQFFSAFRTLSNEKHSHIPIAFLLTAKKHAITINYDYGIKSWHYINANSLPSKTLHSEQSLIRHIKHAFNIKNTKKPFDIKIRIFSNRYQRTIAKKFINLVIPELKPALPPELPPKLPPELSSDNPRPTVMTNIK